MITNPNPNKYRIAHKAIHKPNKNKNKEINAVSHVSNTRRIFIIIHLSLRLLQAKRARPQGPGMIKLARKDSYPGGGIETAQTVPDRVGRMGIFEREGGRECWNCLGWAMGGSVVDYMYMFCCLFAVRWSCPFLMMLGIWGWALLFT